MLIATVDHPQTAVEQFQALMDEAVAEHAARDTDFEDIDHELMLDCVQYDLSAARYAEDEE